jgi:hypothetical protein
MSESESIRYDCSLAAAMLIIDELDQSPGGGKAELLGKVTFVLLEAMYECERLLREARDREPSLN